MSSARYALRISDLRKTYRGGHEALKGIDLDVEAGDFFALLGPNGAGKSTTISILSSLTTKSAGKVEVFGIDIDHDFPLAKAQIGIVPQEINFSQFESVLTVVLNQAGYYGIPRREAHRRAEKYLRELSLWERRDEVSRNLSGGMKRRLMIARALVHEPRLLVLDEPTAGVDIEIRRSMWAFLKKLNESGTTIILTTHYLEEAEQLCRNIAIIDRGVIIEKNSMRGLLSKLHSETFVLDCDKPYRHLPAIALAELKPIDELSFELTIEKQQNMNDVFDELGRAGLLIRSLRNKSNRLEELFLDLVAGDE